MLVTINVTQDDIDQGCGNNYRTCMVARAVNRVIDSNSYTVGITEDITLYHLEYFHIPIFKTNLQNWVITEIVKFDNWKNRSYQESTPEPFSFEINIPLEFLKVELPQALILA